MLTKDSSIESIIMGKWADILYQEALYTIVSITGSLHKVSKDIVRTVYLFSSAIQLRI